HQRVDDVPGLADRVAAGSSGAEAERQRQRHQRGYRELAGIQAGDPASTFTGAFRKFIVLQRERLVLMQTLRQFLRTPKGTLLTIFLALFGLGAAAIGWQLAAPQMLAAVLGATLTDLVVERFHRRGHGWPVSAVLSGMI